MARRPSTEPTEGELELLKRIWELEPVDLGALCSAVRQTRPVATTTIATMLKVMLEKGLVARAESRRGYLWSSSVSREKTQQKLLAGLVDRAFDGSAGLLIARLLDDRRLKDEDREEIRRLLRESKE